MPTKAERLKAAMQEERTAYKAWVAADKAWKAAYETQEVAFLHRVRAHVKVRAIEAEPDDQ